MKFSSLIFLLLFTFLAHSQTSNLTVFNNGGQAFFVILNGIKQNSIPKTNLQITGLQPASYSLKLIFADGITPDISRSIMLEADYEYTLRVVKTKKNKLKVKGFDFVPLVKNTNNQMPVSNNQQQTNAKDTNLVICYRPTNTAPFGDQIQTLPNSENVNNNTHNHDHGTHVHPDGTVHSNAEHVTGTNTNANSPLDLNSKLTCVNPSNSIDAIINELKLANFTSDQYEIIKNKLWNKCVSSVQAAEIMKTFTFESDRLIVAKYCINRMSDPMNAPSLIDLFEFASSKSDFMKFLANNR